MGLEDPYHPLISGISKFPAPEHRQTLSEAEREKAVELHLLPHCSIGCMIPAPLLLWGTGPCPCLFHLGG